MQGEIVLTELGRGAVLGELGLLTDDVRSASIRAVRDSRLIKLSKAQFDSFADLGVMTTLARGLARRIQEIAPPATSRVAQHRRRRRRGGSRPGGSGAGDLGAPRRAHAAADAGRRPRASSTGTGWRPPSVSADKVVLTAGVTDPAWRDFCLRVADRVVLVAGTTEPPSDLPERAHGWRPGPGRAGDDTGAATRLVRGHGAAVDARRATRGVSGHLRPLAARLTGSSLGLVLGGGGARGFAHLGVLEVLAGERHPRRPGRRDEHGRGRGRGAGDVRRRRPGRRGDVRVLRPQQPARRLHRAEQEHHPGQPHVARPRGGLPRPAHRGPAARVPVRQRRPAATDAEDARPRPAGAGGRARPCGSPGSSRRWSSAARCTSTAACWTTCR